MDELGRIKIEIDLMEYATVRSYQLDRRRSSQHSAVMRHPDSNDKIVISRSAVDRHWTYFSVRDGSDHGTIVDFVCRRDRCSISEACRELLRWRGVERSPISLQPLSSSLLIAMLAATTSRSRSDGSRRVHVCASPALWVRTGTSFSKVREREFIASPRRQPPCLSR